MHEFQLQAIKEKIDRHETEHMRENCSAGTLVSVAEELVAEVERLERARAGWEADALVYAKSRECQEQMKDRNATEIVELQRNLNASEERNKRLREALVDERVKYLIATCKYEIIEAYLTPSRKCQHGFIETREMETDPWLNHFAVFHDKLAREQLKKQYPELFS